MNHVLSITLAIFSVTVGGYGRTEEPKTTLRVLSYNIHHAEGVDGKLDLERIAAVINSVSPDFVAVQEVDQNVQRSKNVDQAAELAKLTNMQYAFGGNIDLQGGKYGNLILSKFPILDQTNMPLPNFQNGEQRGLLKSAVTLSDRDLELEFWCTHFDHRRDETERLSSAKLINSLISTNPNKLVILAGDMNAILGSSPIVELQSQWTASNIVPLPTIPVGKPEKQIDFIFFHPASNWKATEVRVLDEAVASDHRAIFAVLELL